MTSVMFEDTQKGMGCLQTVLSFHCSESLVTVSFESEDTRSVSLRNARKYP